MKTYQEELTERRDRILHKVLSFNAKDDWMLMDRTPLCITVKPGRLSTNSDNLTITWDGKLHVNVSGVTLDFDRVELIDSEISTLDQIKHELWIEMMAIKNTQRIQDLDRVLLALGRL